MQGEPGQSRVFAYNGEQYTPQTGLQYLRARHYDPQLGAFTTRDTYLGDLKTPISQNRYTYAHNNPVRYADPSGHRLDVDGPRGPGTTSPGNIRDSYKPAPSRPTPSGGGSSSGGSAAPSGGGGGGGDGGGHEEPPYDPYQFIRLYYKSMLQRPSAASGTFAKTTQQYKTLLANAAKQSVKQKETSKGSWWDSTKNILSGAAFVTKAVIYTVAQPLLDAASFVSGALSAAADDLGFTASQRSSSGSLPAYAAPFGKQNAFAAGRIVGHGAALVAGFLGIIGGSAIVTGGAAVTTTGVLAPAGAVALVGGAVVATAGVTVVASATANITAGDPNIQFSTAQGGGSGNSGTRKTKGEDVKFGSDVKPEPKLANQMKSRGWTEQSVRDTVDSPYTTRTSTNKATGNPCTVYYTKDGSYVIVDDVTKEVVQVSNNINPSAWIPDASIVDPYIP